MKYSCGGHEYEAVPGPGARLLADGSWLVGGRRILVARTAAGIEAWSGGRVWYLRRVETTRKKAAGEAEDIVSPMTGKVTRVMVKTGDRVTNGQVVVIVEAMKMEYRVVSPAEGTVAAVKVRDGQIVEMGAVLVDVKPG
ncbi:MAG: biotin/lipoyl-binding protein [Candidatus Brocadiae bacterium]|nr:biotin/lipoyl-binding protein [Candidatus Brocadiia bacterium]